MSAQPVAYYNRELEERLRFETLLADLLSRFVNLPADCIDEEIENAQVAILESLGVEHSALWQISPDDPGEFMLTHLVRDPNLPAPPRRMRSVDYFPWIYSKLTAKEIVCVPDTSDLPLEAARDMESCLQFGIKAALVCRSMLAPAQ